MQTAMMGDYDGLAKRIVRQFEFLASDRGTWEAHWREISQRFLPGHTDDFSSRGWHNSYGQRRTEYIYDSHPVTASQRCAAIIESQITPRYQMWARFAPEDAQLEEDQDTLIYLDDISRTLARYLTSSDGNFASQNQQALLSAVLFGTGVLFIDTLDEGVGVRFRAIHLSEIFFAQNHQGRINHAYRIFSMTAREAAQEPRWDLPAKVMEAAKEKPEERFRFLHCVIPRGDKSYVRSDYKSMPFASYYICLDGCKIVSEGGYTTFPYAVARFDQAPGEIYGRSPAMDALPAVKMLNEMKKADVKQAHRTADPVLIAFDDDQIDGFDLAPGAINYGGVSADGRALVQTLPIGDRRPAEQLGMTERQAIDDAFFIRLYQVLTDRPEMTAYQSAVLDKEKSQLLLPKIARMQDEYGGAVAVRTLDVLAVQRVFPQAPEQLAATGGRVRVEYDSPVGSTLRASQAAGIMNAATFLTNLTAQTGDPAYIDRLDADEIGRDLPMVLGSAARYIRSDEAVAEIQAARAEAAEEKAATDAAPGAAALVSSQAKMTKAMEGAPGGRG